MSEATKDIQDTTDLDARVAALKADPGTVPPAPASDDGSISFDDLATQAVDEMVTAGATPTPPVMDAALEEAAAQLASISEPEVASPPAGIDQDLAKAVEKLIQETPVAPASQAEPAEAPKKIEALDAQLANLADDLIAGEFADEQNILQGQVGEPPANEPAPPPPPVAMDAPAPTPKVEAIAPSTPQLEASPKPHVAIAPKPSAPKPPAAARKVAGSAAKVAARHGAKAADRLKLLGLKVLELMCLPLRNKPKYTRDLVGWLAIWTLFVSVCLWTYVLFFRSARPPAAAAHVADAGHGEAKPPGHGDAKSGHGEAKSGHGEKKDAKADKAKKPTAKKPPAKKAAGKKEAAASHGGGH